MPGEDQSGIDVKSWFSLEAQETELFPAKKKTSENKKQREEIVTGRSLM